MGYKSRNIDYKEAKDAEKRKLSTFSAAEFSERREKSRLVSIATDEVVLVDVGVWKKHRKKKQKNDAFKR